MTEQTEPTPANEVRIQLRIRAVRNNELPYIAAIDVDDPWEDSPPLTAEELGDLLSRPNIYGVVGSVTFPGDEIPKLGAFMSYRTYSRGFALCELAVDRPFLRKGIGTAMMLYLRNQLAKYEVKDPKRRKRIIALVHECNLPAQLFLRAMGFRAGSIMRMPGSDRDLYEFRWVWPKKEAGDEG